MHQTRIISIVAIIISVIGATIAYAVMSTRLDIKEVMQMKDARWDIHFENLSSATLIGNSKEIKHPEIINNSTTIANYDVKFKNANDGIMYDFEIVNNGNLDAKIAALSISKPICTGNGITSKEDANTICDGLEYTLTYNDDSPILIGQTLDKGERKLAKLKLQYNGKELPKDEVQIRNLDVVIIYEQK